jgi:hypothetical protein
MDRTAFFISDGTALTAERLGRALLAQFPNISFRMVRMPYTDDERKAEEARHRINLALKTDGAPPVVFDTLINRQLGAIIASSDGVVIDVFATYLGRLEEALGTSSSLVGVGEYHGSLEKPHYDTRIDAVHYAMANDDGNEGSEYKQAEIILVGVSRSGKTPSCIYLALQFGIYAANYPITDDDLEAGRLPRALLQNQQKLFGLTIEPQRLAAIRSERRPNSRYASLRKCEDEVRQVELMFRRYGIPHLDTTDISIEEIATRILMSHGHRLRNHL